MILTRRTTEGWDAAGDAPANTTTVLIRSEQSIRLADHGCTDTTIVEVPDMRGNIRHWQSEEPLEEKRARRDSNPGPHGCEP